MPNKVFWNWDIHYACDYRCSYCFLAQKWDIAARENRYPGIDRWIEIWDKIYERYGSCHIHFSGGEPFTYPDFLSLISHLSEKHTLQFSTNLSFDANLFIEKMDTVRVRLDASFHPEFTKLEEFVQKVKLFKNSGFLISIAFVAYPPYLKTMETIEANCRKHQIKLVIQPFRGRYEDRVYPEGYTESDKESIRSCGGNLSDRALLNYHLNKKQEDKKCCYMGNMYGKIYASADVYRCCSTGSQKIGNLLNDDDFRLLDKPEPCDIKDCVCWRKMVLGEEDKWKNYWA